MSSLATQFVLGIRIKIWIIVTFIMIVMKIYAQKLYEICKIFILVDYFFSPFGYIIKHYVFTGFWKISKPDLYPNIWQNTTKYLINGFLGFLLAFRPYFCPPYYRSYYHNSVSGLLELLIDCPLILLWLQINSYCSIIKIMN